MRIVDLTRPIVDHFRWPVERQLLKDHDKGDLFQVTRLTLSTHGFTHMDAPAITFPIRPRPRMCRSRPRSDGRR